MLESQDYDTIREEEKQKEEALINEALREEITFALDEVMCRANLSKLSSEDLLECIQKAWYDTQDSSLYIEEKRF